MTNLSTTNKNRVIIGSRDDFPEGCRKILQLESRGKTIEIGVFNVNGALVAYRNVCPHAGAPVCVGRICGTTKAGGVGEYELEREGEIVRCPWHGWEFDLLNGKQLVDPKMKLKAYEIAHLDAFEVTAEEDDIFLVLP